MKLKYCKCGCEFDNFENVILVFLNNIYIKCIKQTLLLQCQLLLLILLLLRLLQLLLLLKPLLLLLLQPLPKIMASTTTITATFPTQQLLILLQQLQDYLLGIFRHFEFSNQIHNDNSYYYYYYFFYYNYKSQLLAVYDIFQMNVTSGLSQQIRSDVILLPAPCVLSGWKLTPGIFHSLLSLLGVPVVSWNFHFGNRRQWLVPQCVILMWLWKHGQVTYSGKSNHNIPKK